MSSFKSMNISIMATLKSFLDKFGHYDRQFLWPAFFFFSKWVILSFSVYGSYFPVSLYAPQFAVVGI